jgi:hypothetical protein
MEQRPLRCAKCGREMTLCDFLGCPSRKNKKGERMARKSRAVDVHKIAEGKKLTSQRERSINHPDPALEGPLSEEEKAELTEHDSQSGDTEEIQPPLIPDADMPKAIEAIPIQNDRVAATYVGMGLARDKKDEKLVFLEFSFTMTKHHTDFVPEKVADAFKWLERTDNKSIVVNHIEPQTVDVFETPKDKKPAIHLSGASVQAASVAMIEESGKGKTKKVIRFRFRLMVERSEAAINFAAWRDQEQFWLVLVDTQAKI